MTRQELINMPKLAERNYKAVDGPTTVFDPESPYYDGPAVVDGVCVHCGAVHEPEEVMRQAMRDKLSELGKKRTSVEFRESEIARLRSEGYTVIRHSDKLYFTDGRSSCPQVRHLDNIDLRADE